MGSGNRPTGYRCPKCKTPEVQCWYFDSDCRGNDGSSGYECPRCRSEWRTIEALAADCVRAAKESLREEETVQRLRDEAALRSTAAAENTRRSALPSEHPDHIHGMRCDGQDGWNSYCERLRRKLFV